MSYLFSKILGFFLVAVFFYSLYVKKRGGNKADSAKFYLNGVYISLISAFLTIFISHAITMAIYVLLLVLAFYCYVVKK
jgi:hypothetical protein